jgi:hypothetical protein
MMTGEGNTAGTAAEEGKINPKAEKFRDFLSENKIGFFGAEIVGDEAETVLYRTTINVYKQQLPLIVFTDKSIYTMVRILILPAIMNKHNRAKVIEYLNDLNAKYKIFKYAVNETEDIVLDISLPCLPEFFDPRVVMAAIELSLKHLNEIFFEFMRQVWGDENDGAPPVEN